MEQTGPAPGRLALLLALSESADQEPGRTEAPANWRMCTGRVGATELEKVISAVETASLRENVIERDVRELHALYHAVNEALIGLLRGQMALGHILRTVGLRFAVVRADSWIAVGMYGTIGSMIRGNEHEAAGLGLSHV
ncbi:MAG: transcriptional regulator [Firmicutes bacterium]|nr:transcriptional regulator [Bacillota bacterium]